MFAIRRQANLGSWGAKEQATLYGTSSLVTVWNAEPSIVLWVPERTSQLVAFKGIEGPAHVRTLAPLLQYGRSPPCRGIPTGQAGEDRDFPVSRPFLANGHNVQPRTRSAFRTNRSSSILASATVRPEMAG